jgi:hypothetical protein
VDLSPRPLQIALLARRSVPTVARTSSPRARIRIVTVSLHTQAWNFKHLWSVATFKSRKGMSLSSVGCRRPAKFERPKTLSWPPKNPLKILSTSLTFAAPWLNGGLVSRSRFLLGRSAGSTWHIAVIFSFSSPFKLLFFFTTCEIRDVEFINGIFLVLLFTHSHDF